VHDDLANYKTTAVL